MSTTRAAVMYAYREPLSVEEVPLPAELAPGAALVEIGCTTLCGTDAHLWDGRLAGFLDVAMPMIHGHEMVGRVVAIDPGETRDALGATIGVGDRIVWSESVCGHCRACTVLGETVLCERRGMGFAQRADRPPFVIGGLAEHVYVTPGAQRIIVPDEVEDAWAAAAGCAVKTMIRAFRNGGGVRPGATVVVQGAGPLGLFATAYARAAGARVITIGAPEARLAVARAWGADETISVESVADPDHRVARVLELTGGLGAELVLDFAGAPTANREGVLMCAARGGYVVVGIAGPGADPIPVPVVMGRELRVCGSMNGDVGDLAASLSFLRRYRDTVDWNLMFGAPVGLTGATEALRAMSATTTIKPVIVPGLDDTRSGHDA
jgi:D-arabinose 1-dehydrogenase-like Zn-dependent alcohol dehydrogenase